MTSEDKMGKGDRVGKSKLLNDGVCLGSQSSAHSIGRKRQEVYLGVTTLESSVVEDEG